eukprot:5891421-Pyramimonas_sp.AAC.1
MSGSKAQGSGRELCGAAMRSGRRISRDFATCAPESRRATMPSWSAGDRLPHIPWACCDSVLPIYLYLR